MAKINGKTIKSITIDGNTLSSGAGVIVTTDTVTSGAQKPMPNGNAKMKELWDKNGNIGLVNVVINGTQFEGYKTDQYQNITFKSGFIGGVVVGFKSDGTFAEVTAEYVSGTVELHFVDIPKS